MIISIVETLKRLYMYTTLRVILIGQYSCAQQNIWHYTMCVRSDKLKHFLCVNLKLYKLHGLTGIHGDPSTIAFRLTCYRDLDTNFKIRYILRLLSRKYSIVPTQTTFSREIRDSAMQPQIRQQTKHNLLEANAKSGKQRHLFVKLKK